MEEAELALPGKGASKKQREVVFLCQWNVDCNVKCRLKDKQKTFTVTRNLMDWDAQKEMIPPHLPKNALLCQAKN